MAGQAAVAEGSKAFARYREVDEDLQRTMVDLLE